MNEQESQSNSVGAAFRRLRLRAGYNVAQLVRESGVSRATIAKGEANKADFRIGTLLTLLGTLGSSLSELEAEMVRGSRSEVSKSSVERGVMASDAVSLDDPSVRMGARFMLSLLTSGDPAALANPGVANPEGASPETEAVAPPNLDRLFQKINDLDARLTSMEVVGRGPNPRATDGEG